MEVKKINDIKTEYEIRFILIVFWINLILIINTYMLIKEYKLFLLGSLFVLSILLTITSFKVLYQKYINECYYIQENEK